MDKNELDATTDALIKDIKNSIKYFNSEECMDFQRAVRLDNANQRRLDILKLTAEDLNRQVYSCTSPETKKIIEKKAKDLMSQYNKFGKYFLSYKLQLLFLGYQEKTPMQNLICTKD